MALAHLEASAVMSFGRAAPEGATRIQSSSCGSFAALSCFTRLSTSSSAKPFPLKRKDRTACSASRSPVQGNSSAAGDVRPAPGQASVVTRAQATETGEAAMSKGELRDDTTMCILSGDLVDDPEREAQELQEKVIKQLRYATVIFPALALSRMIDGIPGLLDPNANKYEEFVTVISAVDPLLVGIFAYGTAQGLQKLLEREKCHEETLENMRRKATESLVNFFERANLVVFGVALASFSRLLIEIVTNTGQFGELLEYGNQMMELSEIITAYFDLQ